VNEVLLKGIVGSTAYGLAHEGSDVDYLGVFAAPTREVLGLHPGKESVVHKDPDTTLHEAKKFVQLVLNGNPSVSELLWLDTYEQRTYLGAHLVEIRKAFLSAPRVRDAYMGYATSQFGRLIARGDGSFSADTRKRTEKHARHLVRLVEQGFHLYISGELLVNVTGFLEPEWVFQMGRNIADDPKRGAEYMVNAQQKFDGARSCLPGYPDEEPVEKWLMEVREKYWTAK
jgi:predicted nucleotidyltransferase